MAMDMEMANSAQTLYEEISEMIEQTHRAVYNNANSANVLLFWNIGKRVNHDILNYKRADYGKQIVVTLARQLEDKYGRSYEEKNLRRMLQFAEQFSDEEIVVPLARHLTWSHFLILLPLKKMEAKIYYAQEAARHQLGKRGLRQMVSRKVFERREIADTQITDFSTLPHGTFKDPYLFDMFGLRDEYMEVDLEEAILHEIRKFILEFGKGFTFAESQKRMIIDGEDHYLDLLFYNRYLKRLVAVELKQGKFRAAYNGQMKLYLGWLDQYERLEGENAPIGIILCSETSREQIELLKLDRDGILVAEYWTTLPPKTEFEQKIHAIWEETKERIECKKLLGSARKMIENSKDD